ncbi:ornithine carbamoyltransferase [Longimicrobium terrae]|uniref:Ornithine carbamoyltransferase n=1 Tax=Longimicrobium terrae TaxID=1639882 RepID=A0A841GV36_9BACT|nr:ornithine carbamoyltransferase [Longimicrobium terrae]MBB4634037.1 ornithine carbamoyltransferase [Longimicrobium terrae]MBB6069073.1 ornithine carbamoyltransferase [Longimicrobium terrae]
MSDTQTGILPIPPIAVRGGGAPRRHVLSILDLSADEVLYLCRRAVAIKRSDADPQTLRGRTVGVYFRKTSTRTRTGFLVGAGRLGATTVAFGSTELQTNTGESLGDTARTLAGYLDVLVMRTNESVAEMQAFAAHPSMSVINALSSDEHPTQALTDLSSMLEHFGRLEGLSVLYLGEGNRTAASLALAMSRIPGTRLVVAAPEGYGLDPRVLAKALELAAASGAVVQQTHDADGLEAGFDVVYTSRWQEMGVSKPDPEWKTRFAPFRVTRALAERVSAPGAVFMHDLPAVRNEDVDDEVLDGERSLAWVQAQYKMWSAMSVMEWCGAGVADEG